VTRGTTGPQLEHPALLEAIGRALGQDAPYAEFDGERVEAISLGTMQSPPAGASRRVLGGAVDAATGRVAWVEERSDQPQGNHVPVEIDLHVAWDGQRRGRMPVPTYNPYFGCRVQLLRWYGEALVLLYREKHRMLAARLDPPYDTPQLVVLRDGCAVDGDTVYFVSRTPGLLEGRLLPSLAPALPLPIPSSPEHVEVWPHAPGTLALAVWPPRMDEDDSDTYAVKREAARAAPHLLALPPAEARALHLAPERLWARLRELLAETAPPAYGVDVLAGAVATTFWRDDAAHGTAYDALHLLELDRYRPSYLPVYWYQHLVAEGRASEPKAWLRWLGRGAEGPAAQAEAWLRWLERVAALPSVDPTPWTHGVHGEELVARTALAYVRSRAPTLLEVCRTGQLPEGESCNLFPLKGAREGLPHDASWPEGFREVLRQVASRNPKRLVSP
jgi:hypothetical protein